MTTNTEHTPDIRITLAVEVTVAADTSAEALAEGLFEFLANNPDNLFPEILTVENYGFSYDDI